VLAAGAGRVLAVLSASVYLQGGAGVCCVGPRRLGAGPLNVLFDAGPGDFPRQLRPGDGWSLREGALCIGHALRIRLGPAGAPTWWPPAPCHTPASRRRGVAALASWLATRRLPDSPLAMVSPGPGAVRRSGLGAAGDHAIGELDGWLRADHGRGRACEPVPEGVLDLIGRGPGLTPSGDDLLAGALVALRGLGEPEPAERLAATVMAQAPLRTSTISVAHLQAAARGAWLAPLHRLLGAVARGRGGEVAAAAQAVETLGHRSGSDALAGLWLVARAARC
jgi:hypothetical protein